MKRSEWDKRIQRAIELGERFSYAAEVLAFYRRILEFQNTLYQEISSQPLPERKASGSLRQGLPVDAALRYLPGLLALVERNGPSKLAEQAKAIGGFSPDQQRQMIENFLSANDAEQRGSNSFFARVLLQPYAENLAAARTSPACRIGRFRLPAVWGSTASCRASSRGRRWQAVSAVLAMSDRVGVSPDSLSHLRRERLSETSPLFSRRYRCGPGGSL